MMSTVAWVGPGGNWSDGSSWIGGKVPAPGDTALLTGTPSIKDFNIDGVTIDNSPGARFVLSASGTVTFSAGTSVVVTKSLDSSSIETTGVVINYGAMTAAAGGNLNLSIGQRFTNAGTMVSAAGTYDLYSNFNYGKNTFINTGTISVDQGYFDDHRDSATLINNGTITASDPFANNTLTSTAVFHPVVGGSGTVSANNGLLDFRAGAASSQTVQLSGQSTIILAPGILISGAMQASILGLQAGDRIDFGTANVDAVTLDGNTLSFTFQGSAVGSLRVGNGYKQPDFKLSTALNADTGQLDAALTLTRIAAPSALNVVGASTGQATSDSETISPLSTVRILEPSAGQAVSAKVTLSAVANGNLSGAAGTYDATAGFYTVTGSATSVQAALQSLVFTPTKGQAAPGQSVTTSFGLSVSDVATQTSATASVVATAPPPPALALSGLSQGLADTGAAPVQPFSLATVTGPDSGVAVTLSVLGTFALPLDSEGTLSGTGLTKIGNGTYSLAAGSAASVTAALRAIFYTPPTTVPFAAAGSTPTLTLGVSVTDTAGEKVTGTATVLDAPGAKPTPVPTPTPTPTPAPTSSTTTVGGLVGINLPASGYSGAAIWLATAGLSRLAGASGTVGLASLVNGSIGAPSSASANAALSPSPSAGSALALPSGFNALVAQGGGAVTLSDAGAAGAVLVGNGAGDTFNSTGIGVTLVGGQGANTFNVSGSATVATGDGKNTVRGTGQATLAVTTGTDGSTVLLAGGASTVQANGPDTVFGGAGTATVTAAKGAVAIGGAGLLTYTGGSATSVVFGGKGGLTFIGGSAFEIAVGTTGPLNARAGSGGGEFFGNAGGDVLQSGSGQTIMVLSAGGKAVSTGSAGNYLVAGAGAATLDGSAATGNDVFFGGTGQDAILCGSGNDLIGTGSGTSTVKLGSGSTTVFAFGSSTVTAGSGSATVVMGGTVALNIAAGAARSFALFNFVPGTDRIALSGYDGGTIGTAIANQSNSGGQTVLTLGDQTRIQLIGVTRADAGFFG